MHIIMIIVNYKYKFDLYCDINSLNYYYKLLLPYKFSIIIYNKHIYIYI